MKSSLLACLLALGAAPAFAAYSPGHRMADREQPLTPAEAAKSFTVPDDLVIEQVLAEPLVRQPVFLNFDERGRMWVVQYLQYPAPAGLTVVSKDVFWRTVYDKVPEPPPRGVKGADKITIHEDTDGDGTYDKHKTFVEGLNIATSCVKGRGGVWVLNPPYLLFYPDTNNDDVPDGDPVVHLEGFGLEDTHSVVNSLRWGPDGWLYAAQGSTVTANVRVVVPGGSRREEAQTPIRNPQSAIRNNQSFLTSAAATNRIYSQGQNIWRYHPERHIYEIFAEGGGNAFGVEIDPEGRIFSGHNGGDTRGFHYMQGAYLRKGFEKHGELSNPHAFGWFPHMEGTKGERFTHTFILYHGGALPARYTGKLFGVEPLQGRIVLSEITPDGSTFKTRDLERVVTSSDSWFRPVDIKAGPDGAIYIADWYDRQVTHTRNQEGLIDRSNGRIYRLKHKNAKSLAPFDLGKLSTRELAQTLNHSNLWFREHAARLVSERSDFSIPNLRIPPRNGTTPPDLESLWALTQSGRYSDIFHSGGFVRRAMNDPDPQYRLWIVRFLADKLETLPDETARILADTASRETNIEVRAQLACTAKRLPAKDALPIVGRLLRHDEDAADPRLPLLCWWAIESKCGSDREGVMALFDDSTLWTEPMVEQQILGRLMRRFAAAGTRPDLLACSRLLQLSPSREHSLKLMAGFEEAFKGRSATGLPEELLRAMQRHNVASVAFKLRLGDTNALASALKIVADAGADARQRQQFIDALGELHPPEALAALLKAAGESGDNAARKSAFVALGAYDDPRIGAEVVKLFSTLSNDVLAAAQTLLVSRASWSLQWLEAVEAGVLKASAVPLDVVRQIQRHRGERLASLVRKHWPSTGSPTTAQMQERIRRLSAVVRDGTGDPYAGKKLFSAACASCHKLYAQGGEIGPDLTAYQRGDLDAMLLHVVNPSAEIREGYEGLVLETQDERTLTGFLVERDPRVVVLRGLDGQKVALEQKDILEMRAAGLSLMPEGLLDGLSEQEVRNLFAYLRSTQPLAN